MLHLLLQARSPRCWPLPQAYHLRCHHVRSVLGGRGGEERWDVCAEERERAGGGRGGTSGGGEKGTGERIEEQRREEIGVSGEERIGEEGGGERTGRRAGSPTMYKG